MVDRLVALGGSSGTVALSPEDTKRREKRLSIGVDTEDDDFDEEASEDSDEGWSDDEEVTPRGPPSRANTPVNGDDDDGDGQERAGMGEHGGDSSGQFLAPLPSRDAKLARVARSEDEAVAMMLRPNSRPSSRVFVAVELEEGIDVDAVKKRVDEARSKMIKEALPESPSPGEKLDYHETDLFKKLQSMRDQQTVDDEAASLERSKATENEDDDVEDDDEEGDEGEDDAAAPQEGGAADGKVVKEKKKSKKKKKKKVKEEEGSGATSPREKKSKKKKKTKEDGSGATSPREKAKKKAK